MLGEKAGKLREREGWGSPGWPSKVEWEGEEESKREGWARGEEGEETEDGARKGKKTLYAQNNGYSLSCLVRLHFMIG